MSDDLSEYLRAKEPGKAELAGLWRAAIGLHEEPKSLAPSEREQVGEQVRGQVEPPLPKGVARLLKAFKGDMSVLEMMGALKLGGRRNFLEKYLSPAIELGLVEMTQPNSPRSPTQKYRLTEKGKNMRREVAQ